MIKKIQAGDTEAFDILVRKYYSVIYQFCYRRLNGDTDTAADITQDVFLKLLENIHTVRMLGRGYYVQWAKHSRLRGTIS